MKPGTRPSPTSQPAPRSRNRCIRPLTERDIAALQELDDVAHGTQWSRRTFVADIESADRLHLVAETDDDALVGHASAWVDECSCRITNVAVDAANIGQGHATALLLELISETLDNHRVNNLQLEVRPNNRRAQRLYGRFGFVPVGIDRDFYDRRDEQGSRDALVMAVADVCSESWRERLADLRREHEAQNESAA